ncbi:MAG: ribosome maturation factor RimM [Propionicimonas sp.]
MAQTIGVLVGRVGRPHGLRGELALHATTDSPERRFAPGSQLRTQRGDVLTIGTLRWHSGVPVVTFVGTADRSAAEQLRGVELWTAIDPADEPLDAGEYHDSQLVGLAVHDHHGNPLGRIERVLHLPAQDVLAVSTTQGESLVPFVTELVPEVDLAAGVVKVRAIPGLFGEAEAGEVEPGDAL